MLYKTRLSLILTVLVGFSLSCNLLIMAGEQQGEQQKGEKKMQTPVQTTSKNPFVVIETSMGTIKVELWQDKAPLTVSNFLYYVDKKFYDGLIFHRVIKNFVIQGGGFTPDSKHKPPSSPIINEARSDVPNARGTIAMARTPEIHSASSQFFINLRDNAFLNHRDDTPDGFGYCVFGKVVEGMDVVDQISQVETENRGPLRDIPVTPVVIKTVRRGL